MTARTIALAVAVAACTPAKTVEGLGDAVKLIECINDHIGMPAEEIALVCGMQATEDVIHLISERKAMAERRRNCTVIVVDAGAPDGPGK
jgi:hypothetical protein